MSSRCKRFRFADALVALAIAVFPPGILAQTAEDLRRDFVSLPDDTKPGCYWYWINDNVSTGGITKDLEAMSRVGIGRAFIGHIFDQRGEGDNPPGDVKLFSEEWWSALQWAVKEADRLGIIIGFFNSPGWSQSGGFWIKPSQSMRYLGHSEIEVDGGKKIDVALPVPEITTFPNYGGSRPIRSGPNFTAADFQDVKVIAYLQPETTGSAPSVRGHSFSAGIPDVAALFDGSHETTAAVEANKESTVTIKLDRHNTMQAAIIEPVDYGFTAVIRVDVTSDGTNFREIAAHLEERGHQGPKNRDPIVVPFGEVQGEYLRLRLKFDASPANRKIALAEISLTNEAMLGGYVRKQLGETSPHTKIPWDAYIWQPQPEPAAGSAIESEKVVDLTGKMDGSGRLVWDAPPGKWKILRMGMIPIGTQSHPASPEGRGLEIDKMNRQHAAAIFDGMVGEFLRRTPPEDRKALQYVIADSYETGPQNWTDDLVTKFEERFGYSPVRYLPTLTGRIVDSPEISDRFLWDLRRLIVESVAYEYVGGLREVANKNGLKLWLENYGHWGFISEFLLYGSQTDEVGGEFWESSNPAGNVECRSAASAAHTYGKRDVYAEAFTSGRNFKQYPATLKKWCDWAFGAGINHLILHVYIHQPTGRKPGIIEWFGTAFNRHNTWFYQAKPFIDYMRRGAVLLKAGKPVADIAYYIGENSPGMEGPMEPELPPGYDFDNINSDVLINAAQVVDSRLTMKDGTSYSVLVLPKQKQMRPEVADAIRRLVRDGAIVVGPKPDSSPSLQGYPECDSRVRKIADEVWGDVDGSSVSRRQYGKGWVYDGIALPEVLAQHHVAPDLEISGSARLTCAVAGDGKIGVNRNGGVLFKHRATTESDIYFVANTSDRDATFTASFRQHGRQPHIWNAVTGSIAPAVAFRQQHSRTSLKLHLEEGESVYVVFTDAIPESASGAGDSNSPAHRELARLDGPWTVRFQGQGAPDEIVCDRLFDWSKRPDPNIRYYSGTATYETTFSVDRRQDEQIVLGLGEVNVLATVVVNGEDVGTVWTAPWEIDITSQMRDGENNLRIQVTNTWNNRLVGIAEKKVQPDGIYVSQPYRYDAKNPLMPAGLLGPVSIKAVR